MRDEAFIVNIGELLPHFLGLGRYRVEEQSAGASDVAVAHGYSSGG